MYGLVCHHAARARGWPPEGAKNDYQTNFNPGKVPKMAFQYLLNQIVWIYSIFFKHIMKVMHWAGRTFKSLME